MSKRSLSEIDHDALADSFAYLDMLRESGETNMFGARPYLIRDCRLDDESASRVLSAWMSTFSREETPWDRAKKAKDERP